MPIGQPDPIETHIDRLVGEAIAAGAFDDLAGVGKPIPGAGTVDDDLWWVRAWMERNRAPEVEDDSP